jgi:integrase/recombinase XerD
MTPPDDWFDRLAGRYLDDLALRNYSARTVEDYRYNLRRLAAFLRAQRVPDAQAVTTTLLGDFQRALNAQPTQAGTPRSHSHQNVVLATVRGFFAFLQRDGVLGHDPAAALRWIRQPESLPRHVLTPQEAKKILQAVDTSTSLGYRARVILEVFYATGIRSQELINLRLGDANLEEELLRINQGKGGKDRVVPLSRIACEMIESYVHAVRPQFVRGGGCDRLFLSAWGKRLDRHTLGDLVKQHAKLAGVKKRVTCHVWRHTCATHLLKNNANLRHVQALLGHESLATTERYLRLTITDLKEAHRRCHPREKDARASG